MLDEEERGMRRSRLDEEEGMKELKSCKKMKKEKVSRGRIVDPAVLLIMTKRLYKWMCALFGRLVG